jgi:apolipoprotein N-acyltransferase
LAPEWRDAALAPLAEAATRANATVVAGFNTQFDGAQRNVAWMLPPVNGAGAYAKRRLVLGLETSVYTPGATAFSPINGIGLEICKDMDFADVIRADVARKHPNVLAVPAWDFGADRWSHARIAILRSIENGVPMARAAREGLLTLNDCYGRLVARALVKDGFAMVVAEIPLHGPSGQTLYARIGDLFGWLCLALGAGSAIYAVSSAGTSRASARHA